MSPPFIKTTARLDTDLCAEKATFSRSTAVCLGLSWLRLLAALLFTVTLMSVRAVAALPSAPPTDAYWVDPINGSDSATASQARSSTTSPSSNPWKTLSKAISEWNAGNLSASGSGDVEIILRGGLSYERGKSLTITRSGTSNSHLVIKGYRDDIQTGTRGGTGKFTGAKGRFVLRGNIQALESGGWEQWSGAGGGRVIYRTTGTHSVNGTARANHLGDTTYNLQLWPANNNRANLDTDTISGTEPAYLCPAVVKHTDDRIYVRLELNSLAQYMFENNNFPTTPTQGGNPNSFPFAVYDDTSGLQFSGTVRHVDFQFWNIEYWQYGIRATGSSTVLTNFDMDYMVIQASYNVIWTADIAEFGNSSWTHCDIIANLPPTCDRNATHSNPIQEKWDGHGIKGLAADTHNIRIEHCRIVRCFDGINFTGDASQQAHDVTLLNNHYVDCHDDTINLQANSYNMEVGYSYWQQCFAGVGIQDKPNMTNPAPDTTYIHHNIMELHYYQAQRLYATQSTAKNEGIKCGRADSGHGDGACPYERKWYHNVILCALDANKFNTQVFGRRSTDVNSSNQTERYNNIFIQTENVAYLGKIYYSVNENDYNIWWRDPAGDFSDSNKLWPDADGWADLATFKASGSSGYNSTMHSNGDGPGSPNGWEEHGKEADPSFVNGKWESIVQGDLSTYFPASGGNLQFAVSLTGTGWPGTSSAQSYVGPFDPGDSVAKIGPEQGLWSDEEPAGPAAPSGLTATTISSSQIDLSWTDNSSDETGFKIERKTGAGGAYGQIDTTGANVTTYNNAGLAANTEYYYKVRATNGSGDSAYSNEANATTQSGGGGTTVTFTSVGGTEDGRVLESSETSNVGSSVNSGQTDGIHLGDATQDRQWKGFVSFDTSSLPDGATILSAKLRLRRASLTNTSPFTWGGDCQVDIKSGTFGAADVESSDFEATASATNVAQMSNPASDGDWSEGALNSSGLTQISTTGKTQLRVYFSIDDNDNGSADKMLFNSGSAASGSQPELVVEYSTSGDTEAPTVSVTAPSDGASVSGTSLTVSANASDNVGVEGVQFKLDGANLGVEDTTSPYSVNWDTTTAVDGAHALTAVARDAAGNSTTSTAVNVTVDNSAPTISVTAPTEGASVKGSISVAADASDNVGVVGVQFKLDGSDLGAEDTASPYSVNWDTTTATDGAHALTAVVRDAAGNSTTSTAVNVTVDNAAPSVSVTSPADQATVSGSISVTADAADNVSVVGVQFKLDGANLGAEDTTSPYSTDWDTTTAADGAHVLTAVARDAAGNSTTSTAVNVTVDNSGSGPTTYDDWVASFAPNVVSYWKFQNTGADEEGTQSATITGSPELNVPTIVDLDTIAEGASADGECIAWLGTTGVYADAPHNAAHKTAAGTIVVTFQCDSLAAKSTLVAADSNLAAGGLSMEVQTDGSPRAFLKDASGTIVALTGQAGDVQLNQAYTQIFKWGTGGLSLAVYDDSGTLVRRVTDALTDGVTGTSTIRFGAWHTDVSHHDGPYGRVVWLNRRLSDAEESDLARAKTINRTTTVTFTSVGGTEDGRVLESSETSNVGGSVNSGQTDGIHLGDANQDRQWNGFVSFDTSSLPDGATIVSATLRLRRASLTNTSPFTWGGDCQVDIKSGTFGAADVESSDFEATASATNVAQMSNPASDGDWSEGALNSSGLAQINATGKTQLRIYFSVDDNDDGSVDKMLFHSGSAASGSQPELVVEYSE